MEGAKFNNMKKFLLILFCCVLIFNYCSIVYAADISGDPLGGITVASDIGTEAHMTNAEELAAGEWWKFLVGISVLTVIIVLVSYVMYNHNIWAANVNGRHDKAEKLKKTRHIVAAVWVFIAVAGLITIKLYMKPYSVKYEAGTYNTMYWHEVQNGLGDYAKTGNITLDLVIRRSIFGLDDVFGTAVVDGTKYVVQAHSTVEKDDTYTLYLAEEGASLPDLGVVMNVAKDFEAFTYRDTSKSGPNEFVGPAKSAEEARDIYEKFN